MEGGFSFLTVNIFHVLQSRLGDVHGHRGDRGDQAGDHGGYEVAEDSVLNYWRIRDKKSESIGGIGGLIPIKVLFCSPSNC